MTTASETSRPRAFDPSMAAGRRIPTEAPGWDMGTEQRIDNGELLAKSIAWMAMGLGVAELVAPETIARGLGLEEKADLVRMYGVREVVKSVGILNQRQPVGWMWARVAGDVLDLATLADGLSRKNRHRGRVFIAMAAIAGVTALDVLCAKQLSSARRHRIRPSEGLRAPLAGRRAER
jgi:hypothetical protein